MEPSRFERALDHYATSLTALEKTALSPSAEQILTVLIARDAVQAALTDKTQESMESLLTVIALDKRFKGQAPSISQVVTLADWRVSVNPAAEAWWWFFEPAKRPQRWDRFDWLWSVLVVLCLTAALSLVVDISSRFLSSGPDTLGAFAVIAQSGLTLLAAGGALTTAGQEVLQRMLRSLTIPEYFWQEVKLGFAVLLLLGLIGLHFSLPLIAVYYNNRGDTHYRAGQLTSAQVDYSRALKLNPNYVAPHYNLGVLYEDLQDFALARTEYQLAVRGGLDLAYNNLARLYIRDKMYSAAVPLLLKVLRRCESDQEEKIDQQEQVKRMKYYMLKNLGWARLEQTRYAEAKGYLEDALKLVSDRAPAHCLLAQVLEGQKDKAGGQKEWEECLRYASSCNPDEDAWIDRAQQAGATQGDK